MATLDFGDCEMDFSGRIDEAVRASGRYVDAYVYLVGGKPVPSDSAPSPDAVVVAVRVASGG